MASICLYFQIHQPYRLRRYTVFDTSGAYFDDELNRSFIARVAQRCYLPALRTLLDLARTYPGRFRVTLSISGTALEQLEAHCPDVMRLLQRLNETGAVEFLAETYYHSLAFLYSREEFAEQVRMHQDRITNVFGRCPTVFRNTSLLYNNDLAAYIRQMGFEGILAMGPGAGGAEGGSETPSAGGQGLYHPVNVAGLGLLIGNRDLSADIAGRFADQQWSPWPLTATKFADWLEAAAGRGPGEAERQPGDGNGLINLFMDLETFGERHPADSGVLEFLSAFPREVLRRGRDRFVTAGEAVSGGASAGPCDVPEMTSWAAPEYDLSAWLGNKMQSGALHELYRLGKELGRGTGAALLTDWRRLQSSDHFYYIYTSDLDGTEIHAHFNAYESPYDAYINFMNVLDHLQGRITEALGSDSASPSSE